MTPVRRYFVSWIDPRTDPWPLWERYPYSETARDDPPLSGHEVRFLRDGEKWAGMPLLHNVPTPGSNRTYNLPGIGLDPPQDHGRVYAGPTITALFHPNSPFADPKSITRFYLLHRDQDRDAAQVLWEAAERLDKARRGARRDNLSLVKLENVTDPHNHNDVLTALKKWLSECKPFRPKDESGIRPPIEININLSPGTETMGVCWLLLNWNGLLGDQDTEVKFFQGDGGRVPEPGRKPLLPFVIDDEWRWHPRGKHIGVPEADPPADGQTTQDAKAYYLSWIDPATDPWPEWPEELHDQVHKFPNEHPKWPGLHYLRLKSDELLPVSHVRTGTSMAPEILDRDETGVFRVYAGATLTALFHPKSPFCDLKGLEKVCLLHAQKSAEEGEHPLLAVVKRLCKCRKISEKRIVHSPVSIPDPTSPKDIRTGLVNRLRANNRFGMAVDANNPKPDTVKVNLGPGTRTMHLCWLLAYWSGLFEGAKFEYYYPRSPGVAAVFELTDQALEALRKENLPETVLNALGPLKNKEVGQEDVESALPEGLSADDKKTFLKAILNRADVGPLREVLHDALADWRPAPRVPVNDVRLDELKARAYQELRKSLDQAALLGLPVLLHGERGCGKTFLARYYHDRCLYYRKQRGYLPAPGRLLPAVSSGVPEKPQAGECYSPERDREKDPRFVVVTLSEFEDVSTLRDTLFGWAKGAFTGVGANTHHNGLLGLAHEGTLFLDEIHHLEGERRSELQGALLGPLNDGRYRPKMAVYELISTFNLVAATNNLKRYAGLADDFRDRVERVILKVPSFEELKRDSPEDLLRFFDYAVRARCFRSGLAYTDQTRDGSTWDEYQALLREEFDKRTLSGNWRDLQRLADNALLRLTSHQQGRPNPLTWDLDLLRAAFRDTFRGSETATSEGLNHGR